MKQTELIKWCGFVGMLGAALIIIGSIIHPPIESPETIVSLAWVWAHILNAKGAILLLLGLVAIFSKMAEKSGKLGLLGFVLTFVSLAELFIIFSFAAMIEPILAKEAPELLDMNGPLFQGLFGLFFMATVITTLFGFLLFGISVYKTNKEKWPGAAIILGTLPLSLIFIKPETPEFVYNIGFIIISVGFLELSRQVWEVKTK